MKKISLICLFALVFCSLEARGPGGGGGARGGGGRGGGGRGGGGSRGRAPSSRPAARPTPQPARRAQNVPSRPSQNINRTPAMSRPPIQQQAPRNVQRPAQRPAQQAAARPRPTVANQAAARNETRQFSQQLRNVQGNAPRQMDRPQNFTSTLQNQTRNGVIAANHARNTVRQRYPDSGRWFNDRFFDSHRSYDFLGHPGANWWAAATWGSVASWLPYGWQDPYYYYYPGYSEFGYPPSSDLYVQLTEQALGSSYQSTPSYEGVVTTDAGSWMPLGVFATGVSEQDASYSNFFIQLAVDKSGQLAGTFYNAATDEAQPLAGTVDQTTQQAVWKVSDNPNFPVMMTGLYNLTTDVAEAQVYFADQPQSWVLVRVNK